MDRVSKAEGRAAHEEERLDKYKNSLTADSLVTYSPTRPHLVTV